jgi:hypothetical protein
MIVSGIFSDWPGTERHLIESRLHLKDQRQHIKTDMLNELGHRGELACGVLRVGHISTIPFLGSRTIHLIFEP